MNSTHNINELPMYGKEPKAPEMIEADNKFIDFCIKEKGDRKSASKHSAMRGWEYINKGDLSTAMKRFNQAWLLDSLNASSYWGMAVIVGNQGDYNQSTELFDMALPLDSLNARLISDMAQTYERKGVTLSNSSILNHADSLFSKASKCDSTDGAIYYNWATLKFYLYDYKAAWEKISKAEELKYQDIDNRFINELTSKQPRP
jgi:Tfp pilus assembly protein PilF